MKRRSLKSIILVMTICIPCFLTSINTYIGSNSTKISNEIEDTLNLKISATFNTTEIDDFPGSLNNWSWAKSQGICTGSGTQLDPYVIDGHIFQPTMGDCLRIFNSRKYFTITNSEFRNAPGVFSGIFIVNVTNGRIINNEFHHNMYGIYVLSMNDSLISENNFYSNNGDGTFFHDCHGNTITNNNLTLNSWQGMWMEYSSNNVLSGNLAYNNNFSGMFLYECDYSTVNNNMLNFNNFSGLTINDNTFATIENNEMKENIREGLYFYRNLDCSVTGNSIHGNGLLGISAGYINDTLITRNNAYLNLVDGIFITNSHGNSITNNNLSLNGYQGMWMEYSSNNIISGNLAHSNNLTGIYLYECDYSTVNDNTLNFNGYSGLRIWSNIFTSIDNNEMKENIREGMYFRSNLNCSIIKNNIKNNIWDGIFARFSNGTLITENYFNNNAIGGVGTSGLRFDASCKLNKIYLNCFNNSVNAIDDGINNQWDNGIKGNYWADYTGLDTNNNGIGDIPYNITGSAGGQDNFPLMACPLPLIEVVEEIPSFNLYIVISVIIFSIGIIWIIKRKKHQVIHI